MNELKTFENDRFGNVRVTMIDNEPWFVAADVCKALELGNPSMTVDRLDDDEKGISTIDTLGGKQRMAIINEPGLYSLVITSRKPEAKVFKRWITHDVIPTIRKTGGYVNNEELFLDTYFPTLDAGAKAMFKQTLVSLREANKKIEQDKPKVFFADSVEISENSVLVKTLAALLTQNGYKIGQNKLFELLRHDGYLVSRRGQSRNMPTQKAIDRGLFEVKESVICTGGEHRVTQTTYVTGKGQIYFVNKYCDKQLSVSNN
nr:MAG TPA: repressor domain protein [Caudoviricetes sp.]